MAKNTNTQTSASAKIQHVLMPKHTLLSDKEKEAVLKEYNITAGQLPKLLVSDPAISDFNPKVGDVVKVERPSYTMGKITVYRVVVAN